MKELNLPYIGIKIESLPTILTILNDSKNDEAFISYYTSLGKSRKTATEYLASLRNLQLAKKDVDGNTKLEKTGRAIIEDNIDRLYINLSQYCLKAFPDFKLLKQVWSKSKSSSLTELINELEKEGFIVKRKQTLSSYYKLLHEGSKSVRQPKIFVSFNYSNEPLEYHQFLKALKKYFIVERERRITIKDFYQWLQSNFSLNKEKFDNYLNVAKNEQHVKLSEVNPRILKDESDAVVLNNKYYYFLEIM